jgi:large subunit ribosomal protein L10
VRETHVGKTGGENINMALIKLKPSQKPKKSKDFNEIQAALKEARAVYISDYRGLSMEALSNLRSKLGTSAKYTVVKNTVFAKALGEAGKGNLDLETFKGPSAALFAYDDEVTALKILVKFAKENNELPTLKGGVLEGHVLNSAQVDALAKLPGKEQLRGQVISTLAAPLSGFVSVLNGNLRNLVYALNEVQKQKAAQA